MASKSPLLPPAPAHLAELLLTPCVAVHTEATQLPRFADRLSQLRPTPDVCVRLIASCSPIVYARCEVDDHHTTSATAADRAPHRLNALLRERAELQFGGERRIRAHRVYQLDWSCADAAWIPSAAALLALKRHGARLRVVAFPKQLQSEVTRLLHADGYETHPKTFTHELFVTMQTALSPYFHFGVAPRSHLSALDDNAGEDDATGGSTLTSGKETAINPGQAVVAADAPCRAYFKMEESLQHVELHPGDRVLDVGASPGGWTECLLKHGARVVAVDPGELTIDMTDKPVVHLPMLLEDARPQLEHMAPFAMCVCDINVRVQHMAALMASIAHLLLPGARVVFTLKLGKKPTAKVVQQSFETAVAFLTPDFGAFRLLWLHANTQNERTLVATKRR